MRDYKGVIHVHTSLGGHSTGGFDELIDAANSNDLDFVMMTEHAESKFDTSALTLKGRFGKTLFINGQEVDTASRDRFLLLPGSKDSAADKILETPQYLEKYKAQNRIELVTYPEKLNSWNSDFDGIEVFSMNTNIKKANPFSLFSDALWSFSAYPESTLATYFQRPDENLRQFDEITKSRKIALFAGSDAHSNIGFHLFTDDAGNKLLNYKIDRYETIFRLVRTHILLDENENPNQENFLQALKNGRAFIAFDWLGDATGFNFSVVDGDKTFHQGEECLLGSNSTIHIQTPLTARYVIFRNGEKIHETREEKDFELKVNERGVYRVEAYLDALGSPFDAAPWIVSNPIYVR